MQTLKNARPGSRGGRAALTAATLMILTAATVGCTTAEVTNSNLADYDYRLRHPIMISNDPEVLDIPVGMKGPALSHQIAAAIGDYAGGYRADGTGNITIQVPTDSANSVAAASTGRAVHYALVRSGIPRSRIVVSPYYVGDHAKAASLRLSYLRVKAVTPKCGLWPDTVQDSFRNADYQNFGCANQQNLAAMVENPADLVRPRPMTPAHGGRRAQVLKTYAETGNPGWKPSSASELIESDLGSE